MLLNPLSADLNCMRQTLLFGGLESIAHNANRKNADLKFFFSSSATAITSMPDKKNPESTGYLFGRLSLGFVGDWKESSQLMGASG